MPANGTSSESRQQKMLTEWMRGFNKRATNRITMRFAGKHVYAIIHHSGRRSGKPFQTPVLAYPSGNQFYIPLPYTPQVDWCKNVIAAGGCEMDWEGRRYTLIDPVIIEPAEALPAFPPLTRYLLRQTHAYLRLQRSTAQPVSLSGPPLKKILVFGAGVLGSVYAGKLHQAGHDVTLLARGERLEELKQHGLVLIDSQSGQIIHSQVPFVDHLAPEDAYDLVLVVVRKNQLASVLPALAENQCTPNILFLVNNAAGPRALINALGRERIILGFPGGGGQREEGIVRYMLAPRNAQPTTIGEVDGSISPRLRGIAGLLESAGLPVALSKNMDAWNKTHVALVSPIANALYLADGSNYRLARTRDGIVLMIRAVREGLRVLRALKVPITPAAYRALEYIPEPLLVAFLERRLPTPQVELAMARHANAARDEMTQLAVEFRALAKASGVATPAMDILYCYLDPHAAPLPIGQATLAVDWKQAAGALGALTAVLLTAAWLTRRGRK